MLTIAISGYGRMGKLYKEIIQNNSLCNLECIFTNKIENDKIPMYKPLDLKNKLIEKKINALFVCSPTKFHYEQIKVALNLSINVFCEKPICNDINKIKELYNLSKEKGCILFCAFNRRYDPYINNIKDKYLENKLNIDHILVISRDFPLPDKKYIDLTSQFHRDSIIHDIDMICWIVGDYPVSIYSKGIVKNNNLKKYDNAVTHFVFKDNLSATIISSRYSPYYEQRIELLGTKPTILLSIKSNGFLERYKKSYCNEVECFIDNVLHRKSNIVSMTECLKTHEIVELCIKN